MQSYGLELALVLDVWDKDRDEVERLKAALISADPNFWMGKLYPREGPEEEVVEAEEIETSGPATYVMPEISMDEIEELERMLRAKGPMELSAEDLDENGEWV